MPVACELNTDLLKVVNEDVIIIEQWGFELEQIAPTQILIRSIPAVLICSDTISLVKDLLDALYKKDASETLSNTLAQHVNDSGTALDDSNMTQLINEIALYENKPDKSGPLPWKQLDSETLLTLLSTQS